MAKRTLTGIEAVKKAKADAIKSELVVIEGFTSLPENSKFTGLFRSTLVDGVMQPLIEEVIFTEKETGINKVFYRALASVSLKSDDNMNGKGYEAGVSFETVETLLSNPQNLSIVYNFKTKEKSKSGNVYMTLE